MIAEEGSLIEVEIERPNFQLRVRLEWQSKSLVLFGASGSGKTTLLRILLGLESKVKATTRLSGQWLEHPGEGIHIPVHRRRLGWVPQSPTLFPDRSVEENICFGADTKNQVGWVTRAIDVLELGELRRRDITSLSGGERQRVALARAIASRPRALLMDEPLASLDVGLRARILPYLLRIRDELDLPLVYITHDPDEAILLGDEIAVLDHGRLIAQGAPRETLWSQAVAPLATQLGVENILDVICTGNEKTSKQVQTSSGLTLETRWPLPAGAAMTLGLRAEDILVSLDRPNRISARNVCSGHVAQIDIEIDHQLVHVDVGGDRLIAKLTEAAVEDLSLSAGSNVYLIFKSQALRRIR